MSTVDSPLLGDTPRESQADVAQLLRHVNRRDHPKSNITRIIAVFWTFLLMGASDTAYGPLLPHVSTTSETCCEEPI
ncbi:hypothetical protein BDW67DRAFT_169092, partial [Aspergillus spinulosporus]